jgi:hypothetical protein
VKVEKGIKVENEPMLVSFGKVMGVEWSNSY